MYLAFSDGSRVGALAQAIFYLLGIPIILDNFGNSNQDNESSSPTYDLAVSFESPHATESQTNCYESLGCFKIRYPELKGYYLAPNLLEDVSPTIGLHIKSQLPYFQVVEHDAVSSKRLDVSNGSVYWIAHGYLENGHRPWIKELVNELLEYDNLANVFVVDWSEGSKPPYNQAVENLEMIAAYCADLMALMEETYNLKVNETHFIGHSLGAQLGGYLGSWLKEKKNLQIGRISGLDPAQLYFQDLPIDARLDPLDALFVDVIHTDAKPFLHGGEMDSISSRNIRPVSGLGTQELSGHVDFFPNSGKNQPGCRDGVYQAILQEEGSMINGIRRFLGCDHIRSYEYYTESIRSSCLYMAFSCESWEDFMESNCTISQRNRMGFHATKPTGNDSNANTSVVYYSITGPRSPFCREHYKIVLHLATESKYRSTSDLHLALVNSSGPATVLNLGTTRDFTGTSLVRKYTISGIKMGSPTKLILRPSSSNPIRWLMTRMTTPVEPDVVVSNITFLRLESEKSETTFCPEDKAFFSTTDQNPSITFSKEHC